LEKVQKELEEKRLALGSKNEELLKAVESFKAQKYEEHMM
jgi:hypothetical protein